MDVGTDEILDVVIVGAGPTGMMLAGELALAGVEALVLERREDGQLEGSRAGGIHSRTIEILDQRGIVGPFLDEGTTVQTARFGATTLDISDFPTRHPYGLGLWQNRIEPLLASWVSSLGVRTVHGVTVTGIVQDEAGVTVALNSGEELRPRWVVGADGGRSAVRKAAGIGFPGVEASSSTLIAEVSIGDGVTAPVGLLQDEAGNHGMTPLGGGTYRVVTSERELVGGGAPATLDDLRASLTAAYGNDFGVHSPTWVSRFTDATRQASEYRAGRILVAGDAAHVHYPAGGQGIGLGIQDAVNLGWKLAAVVRGDAPPALLDTYHSERHAADARALELSMAQTVLQRVDARTAALNAVLEREVFGGEGAVGGAAAGALGGTAAGSAGAGGAGRAAAGGAVAGAGALGDGARVRVAALIHGLDVAYAAPEGAHPLVGRRMPDLDLVVDGDVVRMYSLLHHARPVLVDLGAGAQLGAWSGRVDRVEAAYSGAWRLPVLGEVAAPTAVLVRPDGHVAWVGDGVEPLEGALTRWFGPAEGGHATVEA
ncbi:FAD-dependent monooxygenase [Cnuibacter physcomitrellae]|uniref:FAD-dependent monooxygenase n=1 Tax=Cnuibacter physcomitrellae TaxID=1619308 RepID=UPI00217610F4|nr:FAD-dependent monooxygenase [Cnuibacter physcomitrellae]MCS5496104.1 FAD-dependent monooxygenase [Cnuibacter physcomitrellae]